MEISFFLTREALGPPPPPTHTHTKKSILFTYFFSYIEQNVFYFFFNIVINKDSLIKFQNPDRDNGPPLFLFASAHVCIFSPLHKKKG